MPRKYIVTYVEATIESLPVAGCDMAPGRVAAAGMVVPLNWYWCRAERRGSGRLRDFPRIRV